MGAFLTFLLLAHVAAEAFCLLLMALNMLHVASSLTASFSTFEVKSEYSVVWLQAGVTSQLQV